MLKKFIHAVQTAVLRAKDCIMNVAAKAQDNAGDIYAEAQQINEKRAEAECVCGDECGCQEAEAAAETAE